MELFDWILLAAFVYVLLRYLAVKLSAEALIAYIVMKNYEEPTKDELEKIQIWLTKKHLGIKTDWKDMP